MDLQQQAGRLVIGGNTIEWWLGGTTRTTFPDGVTLTAHPDGSDEQIATAERLGYGRDVASMVREHEIVHTLLAQRMAWPRCTVLYAAAIGTPDLGQAAYDVESDVLAIQATLNGAELPAHGSGRFLRAVVVATVETARSLLRPKA